MLQGWHFPLSTSSCLLSSPWGGEQEEGPRDASPSSSLTQYHPPNAHNAHNVHCVMSFGVCRRRRRLPFLLRHLLLSTSCTLILLDPRDAVYLRLILVPYIIVSLYPYIIPYICISLILLVMRRRISPTHLNSLYILILIAGRFLRQKVPYLNVSQQTAITLLTRPLIYSQGPWLLACSHNLLTRPQLLSQGPCFTRNVVAELQHFLLVWYSP